MKGAWADLSAAFAFLTIVPLKPDSARAPGRAFAYFPLVGLLIGAVLALLTTLPISTEARAFLTLVAWVVLSGGLHLDGWGDSCDGLFATTTPERRLEIMKDPRAGMWAVIGICLLLLGKFGALRGLPPLILIAPPVAGRWAMVIAAYAFPSARPAGSGAYFRTGLGRAQVVMATLLAVLICGAVAVIDRRAGIGLAAAPLVALIAGRWAAGRLGGGLTGDVYGALCELTELITLWGAVLWVV
jgi:adenosylcobinamide-GDP ribazoletransferase